MKKLIKEMKVKDLGFENTQFLQGVSTSLSDWDVGIYGIGHSARSAFEDALDVFAQDEWFVEHIDNPFEFEEPDIPDHPAVSYVVEVYLKELEVCHGVGPKGYVFPELQRKHIAIEDDLHNFMEDEKWEDAVYEAAKTHVDRLTQRQMHEYLAHTTKPFDNTDAPLDQRTLESIVHDFGVLKAQVISCAQCGRRNVYGLRKDCRYLEVDETDAPANLTGKEGAVRVTGMRTGDTETSFWCKHCQEEVELIVIDTQ